MSTATRIPPFDPASPRGPFNRGLVRVLRTPVGLWFAKRVATKIDPVVLRLTGGRTGSGFTLPTTGLTTTGAKSGQPRTAAVFSFTDGDDVILIASNFGGDRHPAWYHNLVAHPEATLERGGVRAGYRASEVTDADEHARLFGLGIGFYRGYEDYGVRTAAIGRRIPILRLAPVA